MAGAGVPKLRSKWMARQPIIWGGGYLSPGRKYLPPFYLPPNRSEVAPRAVVQFGVVFR